jgi:hypothetical protein
MPTWKKKQFGRTETESVLLALKNAAETKTPLLVHDLAERATQERQRPTRPPITQAKVRRSVQHLREVGYEIQNDRKTGYLLLNPTHRPVNKDGNRVRMKQRAVMLSDEDGIRKILEVLAESDEPMSREDVAYAVAERYPENRPDDMERLEGRVAYLLYLLREQDKIVTHLVAGTLPGTVIGSLYALK